MPSRFRHSPPNLPPRHDRDMIRLTTQSYTFRSECRICSQSMDAMAIFAMASMKPNFGRASVNEGAVLIQNMRIELFAYFSFGITLVSDTVIPLAGAHHARAWLSGGAIHLTPSDFAKLLPCPGFAVSFRLLDIGGRKCMKNHAKSITPHAFLLNASPRTF